MKRKILTFIVNIICLLTFFKVFYADSIFAKPITYAEFENKLQSSQFERITIKKNDGEALLYVKDSKTIYKLEMISFESTEEMILSQQKAELAAENANVLKYNIDDSNFTFWKLLVWFFVFSLIYRFGRFVAKRNVKFGFYKNKKNGKYSKSKSSETNKDEDDSEKENLKDDNTDNSEKEYKSEIERMLDSIKNSIEDMDGSIKISKQKKTDVTFNDVIGLDRELDELKDIVDFLAHPEKYEAAGAKLPKGVLLHGKSGVGKTLIAKAIAGEADVSYFQISASSVQNMYVGGTEANIRKLFKEAKAAAPSVIFIDEFDSIAVRRYERNTSPYAASFLNQLLSCMDGFESLDSVMVIAATNHYDQLDEAVTRSGRFDRHIYIYEPDKKARKALFEYYSRDKDVDIQNVMDQLLNRTSGFTGSDIKTMMNEAAILSVRNGRTQIEESDLEEAYRKLVMGTKTTREATPERKKRTAVHEAGHALMALHLGQEVMEVSIISRGNAAGYSLSSDDENQALTVQSIIDRVKIALAGRVAERIIYGNVSAGAMSDLQHATNLLYQMKLKFGMSEDEDVGLVLLGNSEIDRHLVSQATEQLQIDLKKYYNEAVEFLKGQLDALCALADLVYDQETITEDELKVYVQKYVR